MIRTLMTMFLCVIFTINAQAAQKKQLKIGEITADYLGKNSDGDKVNLTNFKGKVVIITFWASWCGPCLKELPLLEDFQRKLGKARLEVIAVNLKEKRRTFRRIVKKLKTYEMTLTHDVYGYIARKYGVGPIPALFIIGKDGRLAYQAVGYGEASIQKIIDVLKVEIPKKTVKLKVLKK